MKNISYKIRLTLACVLLSATSVQLIAQTNNDILKQADRHYQYANYARAVQLYEQVVAQTKLLVTQEATPEQTEKLQQEKIDLFTKIADSYWQMRQYNKAKVALDEIKNISLVKLSNKEKNRLAQLYALTGDYKKAADIYDQIPGAKNKAELYRQDDFFGKLKADSADWTIQLLNINSAYNDFSPVIVHQNILFSSNKPQGKEKRAFGWDGNDYTSLWLFPIKDLKNIQEKPTQKNDKKTTTLQTKKIAGIYTPGDVRPMEQRSSLKNEMPLLPTTQSGKGVRVSGTEKFQFNIATASVDSLGNIFLSVNNQKVKNTQTSSISIMQGSWANQAISQVKALPLDGFFATMHPTVNKQSTLLIFTAKIAESDSYDLYMSKRNDPNQAWSVPVKLAENINSTGNEVFPYIAPDGYLYFSSDGHPGLGGLDLFKIDLQQAINKTGTIESLGYPVNSAADDFGWAQDTTKRAGFFSSNRYANADNIFSYAYLPIPKSMFVSGLVKEKKSLDLLPGATVFLVDKEKQIVYVDKADKDGRFTFEIKNHGEFTLKGLEENYFEDCIDINVPAPAYKQNQYVAKDILLELQVPKKWVLENLLYDLDKWNIRKDAQAPLDSVVAIMKKYPIFVELGSHTDSRGSDTYNERLSQRRAQSAVDYIVSKGISHSRITAKGYGETQPTNECKNGVNCSEEQHQANRRTEIKVTHNPEPAHTLDPNKFKKGDILKTSDFPDGFFGKCRD